jgi:hypothetical protein
VESADVFARSKCLVRPFGRCTRPLFTYRDERIYDLVSVRDTFEIRIDYFG